MKKTEKALHCRDLKPLIEKAIKQLENGDSRFATCGNPSINLILNDFSLPDFTERISSDYGLETGNKKILDDYYQEISLIEELMNKENVPIYLADWQKNNSIELVEEMHINDNRRLHAIQMWDWYAIPWRYYNDEIHFIWPPTDIYGSPIIQSYPINYFLNWLMKKSEIQIENQNKTLKQMNLWKNSGIILAIITAIFLLVNFF